MNILDSSKYNHIYSSLNKLSDNYPEPETVKLLNKPENLELLKYVHDDSFGAHIFPGNIKDYPTEKFIRDLDESLQKSGPIHLWINIPVCNRRCNFCQFPVEILDKSQTSRNSRILKWTSGNIKEAELWLEKVPSLRTVPIGEFNIFGGTPSLIPESEIIRLVEFYRSNFNFDKDTTLRFEGNPETLTKKLLKELKDLGFTKLSCGIQTFNEKILKLANCTHSTDDVWRFINNVKDIGYSWVSGDLIYGMINQTVANVEKDVQTAIGMGFDGIVCTKLHLKTFADNRTAVSGSKQAAWQNIKFREKLIKEGYFWPTLGEQYQMRDVLVKHLTQTYYIEHPTMYFHKENCSSEKWKSIMVDQDKQFPEVAFGVGGSSSSFNSEAINVVDPDTYFNNIFDGIIPIDSATAFNDYARKIKSVRMALSSCIPIKDSLHRKLFPCDSLFSDHWLSIFKSLEKRNLLNINYEKKEIALSEVGKTLVEAIINTEIK